MFCNIYTHKHILIFISTTAVILIRMKISIWQRGFAKGIAECVNISFWSWMSQPIKACRLRVVCVFLCPLVHGVSYRCRSAVCQRFCSCCLKAGCNQKWTDLWHWSRCRIRWGWTEKERLWKWYWTLKMLWSSTKTQMAFTQHKKIIFLISIFHLVLQ